MNILYCGDKKMESGFMMSALSLGMNTDDPLHIFVLTMEWLERNRHYEMISLECIEQVDAFLKTRNKNSMVERVVLPERFKEVIRGVNIETRFTPYCMLRLLADVLEDIPDKILYLDTDVICRNDPEELYRTDISDYEFAGVRIVDISEKMV